MRDQICFEHHVHDEMCFTDHEENMRRHRQWCKEKCEAGWPEYGRTQHTPIAIDPSWLFCPLCGRRVQ